LLLLLILLLGCGPERPAASEGASAAAAGARAREAEAEPAAGPREAEPSSLRIEQRGATLFLREAGPASGRPVLLLHGARFDSGTWQETGTLAFLAGRGDHALALDLPGYGESEPMPAGAVLSLADLIDALGLRRPVVVAPSMSGRFAFPLLLEAPEKVGGFVAVAPAGVDRFAGLLGEVRVPALVVWGAEDRVFPVAEADRLARALEGSRKVILPRASHACYLDDPAGFHEALASFLDAL
jgi:abhydrolase domain-containing protein 14